MAAPARRDERSGRGAGLRRALVLLIVAALVAAGVAIAVSQSSNKPHVQIESVSGSNAGDTISKMNQLIDDNTQ